MAADPPPIWLDAMISLGISLIVFALGYWLIWARQIRHLNDQRTDRQARLLAAQAPAALVIAKEVERWAAARQPEHGRNDVPYWSKQLPDREKATDAARLANDPDLKRLLREYAEVREKARETEPQSWLNVALVINRDKALTERLGPLGVDPASWTQPQREYLAPLQADWRQRLATYNSWADRIAPLGVAIRERAEALLRDAPELAQPGRETTVVVRERDGTSLGRYWY